MDLTNLQTVLETVSGFIWGPFFLIPLLLGTGLYLTIRLGGLQFVRLGSALRLGLFTRNDPGADGDISQFQALTTALAATVGTGNIVGVATAIGIGGPGALFWMWITGLLGMASKYSEAFLGVRFRKTDDAGEKSGGPQYYLERGIRGPFGKVLALSFAVFAVIACFGIGNMTQGNSIAQNLQASFDVPTWVTGIVLTAFALVVLVGGIKSIGRVTAGLVPIMIIFYVLGALYILIANVGAIPAAFAQIFSEAFTGTSAVGGFAGSAIIIAVQFGVARGIFSNESGMGSAAIAAAAAKTSHPVRQGLVSMTQTFIDTIIVVTCTGLVIISTGTWKEIDPETGEQLSPALMTGAAFSHGLPGDWGHIIVTLGLVMFAGSTILGWSYYGERNVERLIGRRAVMPFRIIFSLVVFIGCTVQLGVVWAFSDAMNGLMALPNLIGLLLLSGLVARETKKYLDNDPKLRADRAQIDAFMAGTPGWEEWKTQAIPVVGRRRR
ncbi:MULTISPECIES: alanine/glycine:cation symporter family protein [Microbacterium]|uniref:Sodium:alanine symporter family protein n=1 Tax=Microbacterium aurugineum TaxID=2851642 RepID=A0ABY4IYK2_9MICO|nr:MULTISPECIES: sodium:alanine symporter family protein [Microbacterium]PKQ35781.1 MAG: sodium:alanine symporter family protein [Actinobacteria bacterium HGW-Actinobacteria-11]MCE0507893.1 sodium:alanine symporter family protein [Microbacterium sp. KKR3/1]MCK8466077.1 sodium:alanine symporter family protein [Microbacterium aurugineum]MCK8477529.1 sodium:alanine symporter family protein [Microbacterium aurugineum]MCZ4301118.1 sodium:alanine symporter family protein [Microbacterium oxydans]